jgi:hypothetical protein
MKVGSVAPLFTPEGHSSGLAGLPPGNAGMFETTYDFFVAQMRHPNPQVVLPWQCPLPRCFPNLRGSFESATANESSEITNRRQTGSAVG